MPLQALVSHGIWHLEVKILWSCDLKASLELSLDGTPMVIMINPSKDESNDVILFLRGSGQMVYNLDEQRVT
jgi:hypothetical protein